MQTWSISYTADKKKLKNRNWRRGKMNYNVKTEQAHFYDEDDVEIGRMKLKAEKVIPDAEVNLWKHLVEVGVLEEEASICVEDLFDKLNKELGIEEFDKKCSKRASTDLKAQVNNKYVKVAPESKLKKRIPTEVDKNELTVLYDILYTRDKQKSSKIWQDGVLKYHPTLKLGEFYDSRGTLLHKKTMETVEEGSMIEEAAGGSIDIEIVGVKSDDDVGKVPTKLDCCRLFTILYTTDKHKKSKKWLDGRLEYDESSKLARFIDEESGDCFYKKVINGSGWAIGDEFETGMYLIQIDHEMTQINNETPSGKDQLKDDQKEDETHVKSVKKVKSVVADGSLPLSGRSNSELLSLLNKKTKTNETD